MKFSTGFLFLMTFVFGAQLLLAQPLPNGGFEDWSPSGRPAPFDWEEPTGWKSSNAMTEFITAGVRKNMDAKSGTYACELRTIGLFGDDAPGILVNGDPELDFQNATFDMGSAGTPYTFRPQKLSGAYKFSSQSGGDAGAVLVLFKAYNIGTGEYDTVGIGYQELPPNEDYAGFEVDISYKSDAHPDSVVVAFFSTRPDARLGGGFLLIDDVKFVIGSSGVEADVDLTGALHLYPNPASDRVRLEFAETSFRPSEIRFYDVLGQEVLRRDVEGSASEIDMPLSGGFYTFRAIGKDGEFATGSLVVKK